MPNDLRLIPGELPQPYCITSPQAFYADMFRLGQVISVNGSTFYNLGNATPDPDFRNYPWFDTNDGTWYYWSIDVSLWVRAHEIPPSSQSRVLWVGSLTDLQTYDGGNANPPGDASGPMWQEDEDFRQRFPVGPGTFPLSGTVVAVGGTGGLDQEAIPAAALPNHQHIVPVVALQSGGDPSGTTAATAKYGIGHVLPAGNATETKGNADPRCLPLTSVASTDPAPVTPQEKINVLPPYRGIYIIKRTSRIYRVAP